MRQLILIESDTENKKIITNLFEVFLDINVFGALDADEAIDIINLLPEIPIIVTASTVGKSAVVKTLQDYIEKKQLHTRLIVTDSGPRVTSKATYLASPVNWEELVALVSHELKIPLASMHCSNTGYAFLPIDCLITSSSFPCDLYISLPRKNDPFHFVKIINASDQVDAERLLRYRAQGISKLHVRESEQATLLSFIEDQLILALNDSNAPITEKINTLSQSHSFVKSSIQQNDETHSTAKLSLRAVDALVEAIEETTAPKDILSALNKSQTSLAYKQTHMTSLFCHYILMRQRWYQTSHLQTLTLAAFFSDCTLETNRQLAITSYKDLEASSLSLYEKFNFKRQPLRTEQLLRGHPAFSDYLSTVLIQSSGSLDGLSLVDDPPDALHSLSKVFIVSKSFTKLLFNEDMPSSKREILNLLQRRFSGESYKKILFSLEKKF
jgi:hypothetical protein